MRSAAQSRKADRQAVDRRPVCQSAIAQDLCECHVGEQGAAPTRRREDQPVIVAQSRNGRASCSTAKAASDNGTRCSAPPFIRSAGMVQRRLPRSSSDHVAPRASPERAAVRIRKRRQSFAAMPAVEASIVSMGGAAAGRGGLRSRHGAARARSVAPCFERDAAALPDRAEEGAVWMDRCSPRSLGVVFSGNKLPACAIILVKSLRLKYGADTLPDTPSGLRLGGPYRREHRQHVAARDPVEGHLANGREGVGPTEC